MKAEEAEEGLKVFDQLGSGIIYKNVGNEHVSEWYVKWEDGEECAILDFEYLEIDQITP